MLESMIRITVNFTKRNISTTLYYYIVRCRLEFVSSYWVSRYSVYVIFLLYIQNRFTNYRNTKFRTSSHQLKMLENRRTLLDFYNLRKIMNNQINSPKFVLKFNFKILAYPSWFTELFTLPCRNTNFLLNFRVIRMYYLYGRYSPNNIFLNIINDDLRLF